MLGPVNKVSTWESYSSLMLALCFFHLLFPLVTPRVRKFAVILRVNEIEYKVANAVVLSKNLIQLQCLYGVG